MPDQRAHMYGSAHSTTVTGPSWVCIAGLGHEEAPFSRRSLVTDWRRCVSQVTGACDTGGYMAVSNGHVVVEPMLPAYLLEVLTLGDSGTYVQCNTLTCHVSWMR